MCHSINAKEKLMILLFFRILYFGHSLDKYSYSFLPPVKNYMTSFSICYFLVYIHPNFHLKSKNHFHLTCLNVAAGHSPKPAQILISIFVYPFTIKCVSCSLWGYSLFSTILFLSKALITYQYTKYFQNLFSAFHHVKFKLHRKYSPAPRIASEA